ncbi:DUF1539 domain-containing protein [Chlamydia sp. 12-01]|uniref:DUF1539 domain-containing protein n=1 Tax=Chlamydia sp. 12-01 TaxID=3002742 RepID=UPI0035D4A5FE
MSLEYNNFRANSASQPPVSALHGISSINIANQKLSFKSIYDTLCRKLGSYLCLNPELRRGAGWTFTFVMSAIITILLCILLLPIKLILLGLSCCPCVSRPVVRGEAIHVTSQTPPSSRRSSVSDVPAGLDPTRFSPSSFVPIHPEPPTRRSSLDPASIPGHLSIPPAEASLQEITLREYLQANHPQLDQSIITIENLGIIFIQEDDLPPGTTLLNLPVSMFPEGTLDLIQRLDPTNQQGDVGATASTSSQPQAIEPQPASMIAPTHQTVPQDQSTSSQPEPLIVDTSIAVAPVETETHQHFTVREFLNSVYPNRDHTIFIRNARLNAELQNITVGASDDDVLSLPASIAFPNLTSGSPVRPSSLDLPSDPRSLSIQPESALPPAPPSTAEEPLSPDNPRYVFLQNHFPEIQPQDYTRHINLLASLAGVEPEQFDLLQLPLSTFTQESPPKSGPLDYEPVSIEQAQERFKELSPTEYAEKQSAFVQYLIANAPKHWNFLGRLRLNISRVTSSSDLFQEWSQMLDVLFNQSHEDLAAKETHDLARACLFKINSLLKHPEVSIDRKLDILKYIASYQERSPLVWLDAMQQELTLQREMDPSMFPSDTPLPCFLTIAKIFPPFNPQEKQDPEENQKEVEGYAQLLKENLSHSIVTSLDNVHLAPTKNAYLEALSKDIPRNWDTIQQPLMNRIRRLTSDRNLCDTWDWMLNILSSTRRRALESEDGQALARATMRQLLRALNKSDLSNEKKISILSNIAFYSGRCVPTWIRASGQELQSIFNSTDTSTNIVFAWLQMFKEQLLAYVFQNESEWHLMTAFKNHHGDELGLDNGGIVDDQYTRALSIWAMRTIHMNHLKKFLEAYETCGEDMVDSILNQALTGSQDQITAIRDSILADLTTHNIPERYHSDIMEIFFPEDNDYQPSREAICYLLLRVGVIAIFKQ